MKMPVTVTPVRPPNLTVVLIGAGGTGARVATNVVKMLRPGDTFTIVDHDVVEERNLIRQHFTVRDVGEYKADVVARRCRVEADRIGGVTVRAVVTQVTEPNELTPVNEHWGRTILLGCVDNRATRKVLTEWVESHGVFSAYVDAGNELRSGQVLMQLWQWPVQRIHDGEKLVFQLRDEQWVGGLNPQQSRENAALHVGMATIEEQVPDLLNPEVKTAQVPCGIDGILAGMQSLAANQMAAAYMTNMVSWLLDEIPFQVGGVAFGTTGGATAYPLVRVINRNESRGRMTLSTRES